MNSKNRTMPEAAEWFGVTPPTIYKLISAGKLRTFKVGRRRFTTDEALEQCRKQLEREASM